MPGVTLAAGVAPPAPLLEEVVRGVGVALPEPLPLHAVSNRAIIKGRANLMLDDNFISTMPFIHSVTIPIHSLLRQPYVDGGILRTRGNFLPWIGNPCHGVDRAAMTRVGERVAAIGCPPYLHCSILAGGSDDRLIS